MNWLKRLGWQKEPVPEKEGLEVSAVVVWEPHEDGTVKYRLDRRVRVASDRLPAEAREAIGKQLTEVLDGGLREAEQAWREALAEASGHEFDLAMSAEEATSGELGEGTRVKVASGHFKEGRLGTIRDRQEPKDAEVYSVLLDDGDLIGYPRDYLLTDFEVDGRDA